MRRRRLIVLVSLLLVPVLQTRVQAQGGESSAALVNVQGTVSGPGGKPVSGARVDIRAGSTSDSTVADTRTDVNGKFAFLGIAMTPGPYLVQYVSEHDQALAASHLLFHKEPRAGEAGSDTIVMQGLDTVDVSKLSMDALGHSYFGDNRNVVEDLLKFLKGQLAPRPGLSKVPLGSLAYWQFVAGN